MQQSTLRDLPEGAQIKVLFCGGDCEKGTLHVAHANGAHVCATCGHSQHLCKNNCGRWTDARFALCDPCHQGVTD